MSIEDNVAKLDIEVKKYKDQLKKMRDGPSKNLVRNKAVRVLRQKKKYERQLERLRSQLFNMEEIDDRIQSYKDNKKAVSTLCMLQFLVHLFGECYKCPLVKDYDCCQ